MKTVPSGRVSLSDRRPEKRWSVDVARYQLDSCPVTQDLYATITGRRPSSADPNDRLPVENVS